MTYTLHETAELLGLSVVTIKKYVKEGMPAAKKGGQFDPWEFDIPACVVWLKNHKGPRQRAEDNDDLDEAKRRQENYKAEMLRLELEEKIGNLASVEDFRKIMVDANHILKTRLLAVGSKLAPRLAGEDDVAVIEAMIEAEYAQAFEELSNYYAERVTEIEPDGGDVEGSEATAPPDG